MTVGTAIVGRVAYASIAAAYRRHDVRSQLMSVAVQPEVTWQQDDLRVL